MEIILRAVIIEDEPDHLDLLKLYLSEINPKIEIIATAGSMEEAERVLEGTVYDLIFLDINLGEYCSFDLIKNFKDIDEKEIIITTSHQEYAIEAFKYLATDYLLKPLDLDDLIVSVERARKNVRLRKSAFYQNSNKDKIPLKFVAIPSLSDIEIIDLDKIAYLQSNGRYTFFHLQNGTTKIATKNLGEYEKLLESNSTFFRVHNSYIANISFVKNIHRKDGNYLELLDSKHIPISKRKLERLYKYLNLK